MLLFAGYAVAIVIGWFFARAERSKETITQTAPSKSSSQLSATPLSSDSLLNRLLEPRERKSPKTWQKELSQSYPPSEDPEKAFLDLYRKLESSLGETLSKTDPEDYELNPELALLGHRFGQWFEADPVAAVRNFAAMEEGFVRGRLRYHYFWPKLEERLSEDGIRASTAWLEEAYGSMPDEVISHSFTEVGRTGSVEDFLYLKQTQPDWFKDDQYIDWIGQEWPFEERDAFISLLPDENKAQAILNTARLHAESGSLDWVLSLLNDETIPETVKESLKKRSWDMFNVISGSDRSIAERATLLNEFGHFDGMSVPATRAQIVFQDLRSFLAEGDVLYAVRHGQMTGQDVYEDVMGANPRMAAQAKQVRSQVFRFVAENNIEEALTLYDDPNTQDVQRSHAAHWWFSNANPNQFYELVANLDPGNPNVSRGLNEGWSRQATQNLNRFGDTYLQWVNELPAGPNRDLALEKIAENGRKEFPAIAKAAQTILDSQ